MEEQSGQYTSLLQQKHVISAKHNTDHKQEELFSLLLAHSIPYPCSHNDWN